MTDPFQDPGWIEFVKRAEDNLVPKLAASGMTLSIAPRGPADIKFAVELGLSITMDKPILLLVHPGMDLPEKLRRVADVVCEVSLDDPNAGAIVAAAIQRMNDLRDDKEKIHD